MRLRYTKNDGTQMEFELGDRPITIGRSPDADVLILDEKASRIHAGIRLWDGDFYIKDLKSRNGTFVNNERIELAKLKQGDRIKIGSVIFTFEPDAEPGATAALQEMEEEMAGGKGYSTLLNEIVSDLESPTISNSDDSGLNAATEAPLRIQARKPKSS